jgi:DNA sulfur modification protein DndE
MKIFEEIGASIHLQPFALCKIALALSLKDAHCLDEDNFKTDGEGLELNRQTITGEYDDLFKALIISHAENSMTDEEYFPKYMKAHIDRGARYLFSEFKYSNGNFYKHMIELDKGI